MNMVGWLGLGLLMLLAEQVVDRLDGIECRERHFDEDRVPVAHRAIPQSRELQGLQFASFLLFVLMKPVEGSTNFGRSNATPL